MKKAQIFINKPIYLFSFISIKLIKIIMYEFCYNYVEPKYNEKAKLCHMDTDSFNVRVKTKDIYDDITR